MHNKVIWGIFDFVECRVKTSIGTITKKITQKKSCTGLLNIFFQLASMIEGSTKNDTKYYAKDF